MTTLTWIIVMSLLGGALSVLAAGLFALTAKASWIPMLVSYAIGALLGAAFLEVLPHAIIASADATSSAATVLAGILGFFVLEKLVLWRHCHTEHCEGHEHFHAHGHGHGHGAQVGGRSGLLILIGNSFHSFVDGVLIAAAFMENTQLGVVTALAMIAHEIPQQVGDFLILLHSGYTRYKAMGYTLLSSLSMLLGGLLAYFALTAMQGAVPVFLALAAASMIYVAVADLIPGLHKHTKLEATIQQVSLICAGVASIGFAHFIVEHALGTASPV